jgi:hypothetical protein
MSTRLLTVGVALALAATAAGAVEPPQCSRVYPGPSFPRVEIVESSRVQAWDLVGENDDDGLLFVIRREYPWFPDTRFFLQSALPDGEGGMTLGEIVDLGDPDRYSYVRTVTSGDFDGDGTSDAMVYWAPNSTGRIALDFVKGRGDGTYERPIRRVLGAAGHVANPETGDFDGDGKLEIAAFVPNRMLIWSIEGGGFVLDLVLPAGTFLFSEVVDWNADGYDDIAFQLSANDLGFLMGAPQDALTTAEFLSVPYTVLGLATLNDKLLAIEGTRIYSWIFFTERIHQLERDAPEAWAIDLPENSGWVWPSIDLDGDGLEELMFGERGHFFWGGTAGFQVYWGEPQGAPTPGPKSSARTTLFGAMDLNDDGVRDLITSEFGIVLQSEPRQVDEGLHATRASAENQFVDEPYVQVEIGDLDEDGLDDVLLHALYPHVLSAGRSRGDGDFDLTPLQASPAELKNPRLVDLDGDGHLDVAGQSGAAAVAWGRGDGTFGPYDLGDPSVWANRQRYGRLDREGMLDRVELECVPYNCDTYVLRTALGAERVWHATPFTLELPRNRYGRGFVLADLDSDGLDDFVVSRSVVVEERPAQLVWRRSLGDGSFGEEQPVVDHVFDDGVTRIVPTDFDLDGVTDLFAMPWEWYAAPYASVRGDGRGGFEVVWTGERTFPKYGVSDQLWDVDGDGRPDLVAGQYSGWLSPMYRVQIRRGDGLGGFHPVEPAWAGPVGRPGAFRRAGTRDLVRLMEFNTSRLHLELFASTGRVLPEDIAPPIVEIGFTPAAEENHWRVTTVPLDECDDKPRIVRHVVEMLPVRPSPEPKFVRADELEIRLYEVPSRARRDVLLLGPSETEARELYAAAVTRGGVPFESFGVLELGITDEHGDERGPTIRAAHLAQRFVFEDGRLAAAFASHPEGDLFLAVDAVDRSGKLGTTRLSVKEAIASAIHLPGDTEALPEQSAPEKTETRGGTSHRPAAASNAGGETFSSRR